MPPGQPGCALLLPRSKQKINKGGTKDEEKRRRERGENKKMMMMMKKKKKRKKKNGTVIFMSNCLLAEGEFCLFMLL